MKQFKALEQLYSAGIQYEPNPYKQKHLKLVNFVCFLCCIFLLVCALLSFIAYRNFLLSSSAAICGLMYIPSYFLVRSGYALLGKVYFAIWSNIGIVICALLWGNAFDLQEYLMIVAIVSVVYFNYEEIWWAITTALWSVLSYFLLEYNILGNDYVMAPPDIYMSFMLDFGKFFVGFSIIYKLATLNYMEDIKQLQTENKQLRGLAVVTEKTHNMILIGDERGNIEWVNEGFVRNTGYTLNEIKGKSPSSFLHGKNTDPDTVQEIFVALSKGESHTCELINYNKKGEEYWVEINITPIKNEYGTIEQFVSVELDITERKNEQLRLMAQNKSLREISFIQSHEVRRPLASIMGLVDLLSQESIDDRQKIIEYLQLSCQELDAVIERVTLESVEK
jgi:PAS domain S-box-containing protein